MNKSIINTSIIHYSMEISKAHGEAQEYLARHGILECAFEARIIFEDLLNYSPVKRKRHGDMLLTDHETDLLNSCLTQRITGKPLAYIIGKSFFWNDFFQVNEHTLIPRQDTETLVDAIIKLYPNKNQQLKILDLGTGSGCIVLSLLKEYANAQAIAIDISDETLKVAENNAKLLNLSNRIQLINCNWFDKLDCNTDKFHIIVSNPPYIAINDPFVHKHVDEFEPKQALYAKNNGLNAYEIIIANAKKFLYPNANLILEIGWQQWESIQSLATQHDFSSHLIRDMSNNPRCVRLISK